MNRQIYDNVKLSKKYEQLSSQQKDIHQFILANIDNIKNITVEDIAKNCYCSTTTVNRYCKNMGADGYNTFKYALLECANYNKEGANNELRSKVMALTSGLNLSELDEITRLIKSADQVYIFGTGVSYVHAKYLQRLLIRSGINAVATNEVHYLRIIKKVELCIILSNSGETFSAVQVCNQMQNKCPIVAITRANSRVKNLANYSIFHNEEVVVDDSIENELNISIYLMIISLIDAINKYDN